LTDGLPSTWFTEGKVEYISYTRTQAHFLLRTNWGNLGHPGGYTSYDYGAIIAEDRSLTRQKYSEIKLQTNFFKVSPAYLTASPSDSQNGSYVNNPDIATARLKGNGTRTNIYVVRHAAYNTHDSTQYKLEVPTSKGNLTIPQLNGTLTLNGRDSKLHVTDYSVGGVNMLYSSAEIFTWKKYASQTVLVLYGGLGETHEAAFVGQSKPKIVDGSGVTIDAKSGSSVLNWKVTPTRKVVKFPSGLVVYLLDRKDAYNYWVLDLPAQAPTNNFTHPNATSVIAHAGYLLRTASVKGSKLALTGDINATTTLEIIGGAPANAHVTFNGQSIKTTTNSFGVISGTLSFATPKFDTPSLTSLKWKYLDSLPEIQSNYSDVLWMNADRTTNNTVRNSTTPTSLYGSDYGYHTGILLSRGHFTATGKEGTLNITTQGGTAFGASVWLNNTYLGSWYGNSAQSNASTAFNLAGKTKKGSKYVLTVVCDNM
jgi:Beta-galactosidase, domain 2/Beta-galactosidase, domain 3/Beta-galactosidase jelly roll domain/Glycosyl hydrolases family 35